MRIELLFAVAALAVFICGCEKPSGQTDENGANASGQSSDNHGHDHAHNEDDHAHDGDDHAHGAGDSHEHGEDHPAHGPNGGHIFKFDSPEYVGEWQQFPGNDVIKMYILNDKQEPVGIKAEHFEVIPLAGNDPTPFELEADEPDAEGKSAVYVLDDKNLHIAIPLGVTIQIQTGEQTLSGTIDAHEPLDH